MKRRGRRQTGWAGSPQKEQQGFRAADESSVETSAIELDRLVFPAPAMSTNLTPQRQDATITKGNDEPGREGVRQ